MEWVETTGKTVTEAKDRALDQLGVDEQDTEFEILSEPTSKLLGLKKTEARVRARVRPVSPRAKAPGRERKGKGKGNRQRSGGQRNDGQRNGGQGQGNGRGAQKQGGTKSSEGTQQDAPASAASSGGRDERRSDAPRTERKSQPKRESSNDRQNATPRSAAAERPAGNQASNKEQDMTDPTPLADQVDTVVDFLEGLTAAFGLDAKIEPVSVDEENSEVHVTGDDLGLLIGTRGNTLQAVQDLSLTTIRRSTDGALEGRVRVDIAAYRQKRRAALGAFAQKVAASVVETGEPKALEPMPSPDRKAIHDALTEIDEVTTTSEGSEPHRRIVISPAG